MKQNLTDARFAPANSSRSTGAIRMAIACLTPRESESPRHRHARACRGHPRLSWRAAVSKAWMAGASPALAPGKLVQGEGPALSKKTLGERKIGNIPRGWSRFSGLDT